MTGFDPDAAARLLADLRLRRGGITPPIDDLPPTIRPGTLAEAYAVQARLRRLLVPALGPVVGWKIGCTSGVMQSYLGVDHPCMGTMFAGQMHQGSARLHASNYRRLGLECEIAVRLKADLAPNADPAPAIGAVMCSVEIVEERFTDFSACARESLIADDFFGMGCVLGAEVALGDIGDLSALTGGFSINGEPQATGRGDAILKNPLAALSWLSVVRGPEGGLKAGEVATLGSVVKTVYPVAGDRLSAGFQGLGNVGVEVI